MLVHLVNRSTPESTHSGREFVHAWHDSLVAAGVSVLADLEDRHSESQTPFPTVESTAAELCAAWARGPRPDLVHALGVTATAAALLANPGVPVIATFHESAEPGEREVELARSVRAVVSLSAAEHHRWERLGATSLLTGPLPLVVPVPDRNACADPAGAVVTMSAGRDLDELLHSMRHWAGRLRVLATLAPGRRLLLERTIAELDLAERVDLPAASAAVEQRDRAWDGAALVYVGDEDSQHGLPILEAAAHGVPALARNLGASRDLVVSGTTGLLIEARERPTTEDGMPGRALAAMLADAFQLRAMGTAALVRVSTANGACTSAARLHELYARAAGEGIVPAPRAPECRERDALVLEHLPLARQLAGWYSGRGQSSDDLVQVACIGLVQAATRFDPAHGREFHSFAIPTILGEIRRHFRDNAWAVRVPRGLQETTLLVQRATETLSQTYGRPPTETELAEHLDLPEQDVRLAQQTDGEARFARSLDAPLDSESLASLVGSDDEALEAIELRHDVREAIGQLPAREQQILLLRFYGERTQSEISEALGISQVHVSRVLSRTLAAIRDHVMYDLPLPVAGPRRAAVAS